MFRVIVRHCRWLARVPCLPQLFDGLLLICSALFTPRKLRAIESLENAVRRSLGAEVRAHRFGGIGFVVDGREIGHLHGNGLVDAFVGRANRDALVAARGALPHHVFPASGWVSFWMSSEADVAQGLRLITLAREHRAAI